MKEYLSFVGGKIEYYQADQSKCEKDVLIPKGATLAIRRIHGMGFIFWQNNDLIWSELNNSWCVCGITYFTFDELRGLVDSENRCWQRPAKTPTKDERVIWFEKFISGERVQYRVKDTQQWHNMTFKSLVIFDHKDLEFRNAPTVVEIDGFNFHSK